MRGRAPRRPAPGREPGALHPGGGLRRRCSHCRRERSRRGHDLARRSPGRELPAPSAVAPRRGGGLDGADRAENQAGGMEAAHLLSAADVLRRFSVTVEGGLRPEQVTSARERYGPNGESVGLAREAGTRSFSLLPCAAKGRGPLRFQPSVTAGGPEARAPETSADALGALGRAARPPSRGGAGRVPGLET